MPRIREYNNPISGLDVSGAGARATALGGEYAGRTLAQERIQPAVSRFGDAVADRYEQFVVAPELSKGAALFAQYQTELTQKWNNQAKNTDPNDASLGVRFKEWDIEPTFEKFVGGFTTGEGKKWAEAQVASARQHFNTKITADMSTRAGQAVLQNHDTMKNSLSTMVMNDPSSYAQAVKTSDASLQEMIRANPMIDATTASALTTKAQRDLKTELAKAWIIGTGRLNPEAAEKAINEGKFSDVMTATEAKSALAFVEAQRRAIRQDEQQAQIIKEKAEKRQSDDIIVEYQKMLRSDDPAVRAQVTAQTVLNDSRILPADRNALIRAIDAYDKPQALAQVSSSTAAGLMKRLDLPEGDPNKLVDVRELNAAFANQTLNKADYEFVTQRLLNARTPEGQKLSEAKAQVYKGITPLITKSNPAMGKIDNEGDYNFMLFQRMTEQKVDEYRRAGKDPSLLFTPGTPDFIGQRKFIEPYANSLDQSVKNALDRIAPKTTLVTPAPMAQPQQPKEQDRITPPAPVPDAILRQFPAAKRAPDGLVYRFDDATQKWMRIEEAQ